MKNKISRRDFIQKSALGFGVVNAEGIKRTEFKAKSDELPKRKLGRTGRMVTCIGFGGGSRYWNWVPEEKMAEKLIDHAIRLGINYFDNSISYGRQKSEIRYGKYLSPKYRNQVFLTSKTNRRTYDEVMADIETSLKNLQTDYLDCYFMHKLDTLEEVNTLSSTSGGYKAYLKLRDEKVVHNIGVTFHQWHEAAVEIMKRFDLDVIMTPLNAARDSGCEENLIPIGLERNIGLVAMKTTAQNALIGNVNGQDLLRYSLSLPIAVANVGMDGFATLESCVEIAKQPLITPEKRENIHKKLAYNPEIHKLPYLQPGYDDGISV